MDDRDHQRGLAAAPSPHTDSAGVQRLVTHIRAAMRRAGVAATVAPQPLPLQRHQGPSTSASGVNGAVLSAENLNARLRTALPLLPGANCAFKPGASPRHRPSLLDRMTGALKGIMRGLTWDAVFCCSSLTTRAPSSNPTCDVPRSRRAHSSNAAATAAAVQGSPPPGVWSGP